MSKLDTTKQRFGLDGDQVTVGAIVPSPPPRRVAKPPNWWVHDPSNPTHRDFVRYAAWRRTKCQPRDRTLPAQANEDLDQAIHEFVGECAELGDLIYEHGWQVVADDTLREKLLGECGDIFFTGSWTGDAWGLNPLLGHDGPTATFGYDDSETLPDGEFRAALAAGRLGKSEYHIEGHLVVFAAGMLIQAGLLCNSYKKLRYQGRLQDRNTQSRRVGSALLSASSILKLAGYTVEDALAHNIKKLDTRYPRGYEPNGTGGGNRTGAGA